jgi:Kef-type K+ transport system membrane component KefB
MTLPLAAQVDINLTDLAIVWLVAFLVPFTLAFAPRLRLPTAVVEIAAGIIIGPAVLDIVQPDTATMVMRNLGLTFLLFLGGMELELDQLRGPRLRSAGSAYVLALILAALVLFPLGATGAVLDPPLLMIAVVSTSLGVIIPVLKDSGQLHTDFGRQSVAAGTIREFAPILLLAIFFSQTGTDFAHNIAVLIGFAVIVGIVLSGVLWTSRWIRVGEAMSRFQDTTSQLRIRAAVALLGVFSAVAGQLGFETILGAFLAGAFLSTIDSERDAQYGNLRAKLEAIGYGAFVPVFFVTTGLTFDLQAVLDDPTEVIRIAVITAIILVAAVGPSLLLLGRELGIRKAAASGLLQATTLSLLVIVATVGLELGSIKPQNATALVAAGMITVLVFPALANVLIGKDKREGAAEPSAELGEADVL